MLGLESPQDYNSIVADRISQKDMIIQLEEYEIDPKETIYMITWCPDPHDIGFPDADFVTQHKYHINTLSNYLSNCRCGLFCVEATQIGNPHYHGWYQVDSNRELLRVVTIKVMKRFGDVKITKSLGHFKIGSYSDHANCLYYYKKDMLDGMMMIDQNPITKDMKDDTDWSEQYSLFCRPKGRQTIADLDNAINLRKFYMQFYNNSLE